MTWYSITEFKNFKFDGKYEINQIGQIRNARTHAPLATYSNARGQGYLKTKILDRTHRRRALYIHQLVAHYFVGPKGDPVDDNQEVDHIDGDVKNNRWTNLRYCSHRENMQYLHERLQENRRCKYCAKKIKAGYFCEACGHAFREDTDD